MVSEAAGLVALGVGTAIGVAGIGSGIGVGIAGAAGAGAIVENPKFFGKALVFQALPQTQAIYGFLIGILMLFAVFPIFGAGIDIGVGLAAIGAGVAVGFAGLSGIGQGITAAGGIGASSADSGLFGKSIVLSVMSETFAIFGLLFAILILLGLGVLGAA